MKVEAAARKQAKQDFEAERRAMQEKMETEISELQTHLKYYHLLNYKSLFTNKPALSFIKG